jgi:hypothetical protein
MVFRKASGSLEFVSGAVNAFAMHLKFDVLQLARSQ